MAKSHKVFEVKDDTNFEEAASFDIYKFFKNSENGSSDTDLNNMPPPLIYEQQMKEKYTLPFVEGMGMDGTLKIGMSNEIVSPSYEDLMTALVNYSIKMESSTNARVLQEEEIESDNEQTEDLQVDMDEYISLLD